jgi:signal transduction histidine kinase
MLSTALSWLLDRTIGYHHPYSIFYVAVLWSAWYAGLGPGLLATGLGGIAIKLLSDLPGATPSLLTGFAFYWGVCLVASLMIEAQHRAQQRAAWNAAVALDRLAALVRETAQRREAEAAAAQAQEQFRLAFQHAPVGICQIGADGRIAEVNPAFCTILGSRREDLLRQPFRKVLDVDSNVEMIYTRQDGNEVWLRVAISGVPCAGEWPRCAIAVVDDITEHKRSDEQMVETQKLESVALLAGGIAHDFNNLLTAVLGNATLAMDTVPEDGEARKMLEGVVTAGERAARLTSQLLAYAGRGAFAPAEFDLSTAVAAACDLLRPAVPVRVRLELNTEEGLPPLKADASQVQQLVTNLTLNAVESIEERRAGVVRISTGRQQFDEAQPAAVGEVHAGRYLFVRVEDDGSGIADEALPRIFEPFFTTRFLGRGLGLAAVAGIVRSLKGAVLVSTTVGVGSTFTILFPIR